METLSEILIETISELKKTKFISSNKKTLFNAIDKQFIETLQSTIPYKVELINCSFGTSHFFIYKDDKVKIHFYTLVRIKRLNKESNLCTLSNIHIEKIYLNERFIFPIEEILKKEEEQLKQKKIDVSRDLNLIKESIDEICFKINISINSNQEIDIKNIIDLENLMKSYNQYLKNTNM